MCPPKTLRSTLTPIFKSFTLFVREKIYFVQIAVCGGLPRYRGSGHASTFVNSSTLRNRTDIWLADKVAGDLDLLIANISSRLHF